MNTKRERKRLFLALIIVNLCLSIFFFFMVSRFEGGTFPSTFALVLGCLTLLASIFYTFLLITASRKLE